MFSLKIDIFVETGAFDRGFSTSKYWRLFTFFLEQGELALQLRTF